MSLTLTEEEKMLQATVREFAEKEVAPVAGRLDETEAFSWDLWKRMAQLGLTGLGIDPRYGGSGGGQRMVVVATEELARADGGVSVGLLAHLSLTTYTIYRFGDEQQKARLVPPMARGERMGAWALTEPGAGSDAASLQTRAAKQGGRYVLNGTKHFITNGMEASTYVVFCTQDPALRAKGISAVVVEKEQAKGFTQRKQTGKMGMRSSSCAELVFTDTTVPVEDRLGQEGRGFNIAMDVLDSSRIVIAAQGVGLGQAALDHATSYAQRRRTFGKALAEHQAIQFMLADMATMVHASRVATMHAATLKDEGQPFIAEASMAKLLACETAAKAASQALQVWGGAGYFISSPVHRLFRDARVTTIYEGASEVQKLVIARQLLGK